MNTENKIAAMRSGQGQPISMNFVTMGLSEAWEDNFTGIVGEESAGFFEFFT